MAAGGCVEAGAIDRIRASETVEPWTGWASFTRQFLADVNGDPPPRIPVRYWPSRDVSVLGYVELGQLREAGETLHYRITFRPAELEPGEEPLYEFRIDPRPTTEGETR